jgi:hypothetical protein
MDIFDTVFTLFMILFPAVFTLFVRPKIPVAERHLASTKLARTLWLSTGFAVVVYLLLSLWQPAIAYFMWFLFFPLWFLLAMPLLQARDPGWRPLARSAVRTASLERRDVLPPGLRAAWIAIIVLWGFLLCISVLGLVLVVSEPAQWWLLFFNLAAGGELWLMHWSMRRSLIEPEPTLPHESETLRIERASFHRFKLLGWLIVAALVMLIFSLPPLLLIWYGNPALMWAIAVGAGGGALTGIGGGVFGTIASIKRAKINRLCLESSAQE